MNPRLTLALLPILASTPFLYAEDSMPDPAEVSAAMRKATDFYVSKLASHGGYASSWSRDLSQAEVEGKSSKTIISIQPPGTGTVGLAMMRAWEATGDDAFLAGARGAAQALIDCQLESGGWPTDFDFDGEDREKWFLRKDVLAGKTEQGKLRNYSTLDDNKSQSALLLLVELAHTPRGRTDAELQGAVTYAFDHLLAAQTKIGSWPQQFDSPAPADGMVKKATMPAEWPWVWPKIKYARFHTLNDGNLQKLVELMIRTHELTGEARFLDAAKRVGDFLLLAQFEGEQSAWSQQYDENMIPVWARKFEPPALTSSESYSAVETLFRIWLATGEDKYRDAIPAALDWLDRSRLPDGRWARFYELHTNKPLYCVAETYELTYDDSNTPTHYGFKIDADLGDKITRMRENLARPREELLVTFRDPQTPERWLKAARGLRSKVKTAAETQNDDGVWLDDDQIDAGLFVKHIMAMSAYVKACREASSDR